MFPIFFRWEAYCAKNDLKLQGQSFKLLVPGCCRSVLISREFPGSYQVCASPKQRGTFNRSRSAVRHCMYLVHVHSGNNWWLLVTCHIRYCELPTALSTCAEIWKIPRLLVDCAENPDLCTSWRDGLLIPHLHTFQKKLGATSQSESSKKLLTQMCKSTLRTVRRQLCDFLWRLAILSYSR